MLIAGSSPQQWQLTAIFGVGRIMSMYAQFASSPGKEGEKKPVTVPVPNAYAGIASALRTSYAALPIDEQFDRLLAKLK